MPIPMIITKEYPAEIAGERVGWASVEPLPNNEELLGINVVVGTVGEQGARHGYHQHWHEPERSFSLKSTEGFVAVSGLFMLLDQTPNIHNPSTNFQTETRDGRNGDIILNGGSGFPNFVPADEAKTWAESGAGLLKIVKDGLARHAAEKFYPNIYYNLNMRMGHDGNTDLSRYSRDMPVAERFLIDPVMAISTKREHQRAMLIASKLHVATGEDRMMLRRLTVFSDTPPAEIPQAFQASREKVAILEWDARKLDGEMFAPGLTYAPVGKGPRGRKWPYMDPLGADAKGSYGPELAELRRNDTSRANHELVREITELEWRSNFAAQGAQVLSLLAQAEQATDVAVDTTAQAELPPA